MKSCVAIRYDLPRHKRLVNKWCAQNAKHVKALYGLRKDYETTIVKSSLKTDYHTAKACPVDGCKAFTLVMARHLRDVHKMSKSDPDYVTPLKRAVIVDDKKVGKSKQGIQHKKRDSDPHLMFICSCKTRSGNRF